MRPRLRIASTIGWIALCTALVAATLALAPRPAAGTSPATVVMMPREVRADQATPVYGGVGPLPRPGRAELSVCAIDGPCRVVATTPLHVGVTYWGWLGALRLSRGEHEVQLLVRERTRWFGVRTVGWGVWRVASR